MSTEFVSQIRRHAPGTLQNRMDALLLQLSDESGKSLLAAAREVGDHMAGIAAALSAVKLVDLERALPKLGHASERVRNGTTLAYSADTGAIDKVPLTLDPKKIRSVDK